MKSKNIKRTILKWLTNATLVFSLFVFSGHVHETHAYRNEPARTELPQSVRRTLSETSIFNFCNTVSRQVAKNQFHTNTLTCRLLQYQNEMEVAFRQQSRYVKKKKEIQFLASFPTDNSEASYANLPRG